MIEALLRTFVTIFIMELGSASNLTIAALSASSSKPMLICMAGVTAICLASLLAMKVGGFLKHLPVSMNLVSGVILIVTGLIFLYKA